VEEFVFAFLVFFICVFVVYRGIWVTDFECIRSASAGSLINCEWCDDLVFILIHSESPEEIELLDSEAVLLGV